MTDKNYDELMSGFVTKKKEKLMITFICVVGKYLGSIKHILRPKNHNDITYAKKRKKSADDRELLLTVFGQNVC